LVPAKPRKLFCNTVVSTSEAIPSPDDDDAEEVEDSDDEEDKDWGTDSDGREDLKREALSLRHQLTHVPKNKYCPACMRAKMLRKPARRSKGKIAEQLQKFGNLVNADHVLAQSPEACGLFGERDALIIAD